MKKIILYFLPMVIFFGLITSYEDIKEGKIRNKYIILALVYVIMVYSFIVINSYIKGDAINTGYFISLIINILLSLIIGFLIWHLGFWTAGDAKLFLAYSALLPLNSYLNSNVRYFPSLNLLVNTFMPIFVFFLFVLIIKSTWSQKKGFIKRFFKAKRLLELFISLFSIVWIIGLLLVNSRFTTIITLVIIIFYLAKNLFKKYFIYPIIIISVMRIFFDKSIYTINYLKYFSVLFLLWAIITSILSESDFPAFIKKVSAKNLKKGMIPTSKFYKPEFKAEGLSNKEIKKISKLKKLKSHSKIKIKQTLPFAPFMFIGAILTMIVKGNILILLDFL